MTRIISLPSTTWVVDYKLEKYSFDSIIGHIMIKFQVKDPIKSPRFSVRFPELPPTPRRPSRLAPIVPHRRGLSSGA